MMNGQTGKLVDLLADKKEFWKSVVRNTIIATLIIIIFSSRK